MKKTNKELFESKVAELGYVVGSYDMNMERLSKAEMKKVLAELDQEYTDIDVKIRGKIYVVEIATVDDEKDIQLLSQAEYINRYGDERWDD